MVISTWIVTLKAVALLVIVGSSWLGSRTNQSSQTITKWVLDVGIPDPDAREFLAERGMPTSEEVLDLGGMAYSASDRLAVDPRLKDFRAWMATEASGAYAAWLLSHPSELVVQSGRALSQSFSDIARSTSSRCRRWSATSPAAPGVRWRTASAT